MNDATMAYRSLIMSVCPAFLHASGRGGHGDGAQRVWSRARFCMSRWAGNFPNATKSNRFSVLTRLGAASYTEA